MKGVWHDGATGFVGFGSAPMCVVHSFIEILLKVLPMSDDKRYKVAYPRNRFRRSLARVLGRIILPLAFRIKVIGKENFPSEGPLIIVGNHTAIMEVVLMAIYPPWLVEFVGSVDIPHEPLFDLAIRYYQFIPVKRGHIERDSLHRAAGILKQKGIIGIFPEGGIWNPGTMRAQTGVAWLSYHTKTPVLPIAFGDASGALANAFRLKRPKLSMYVGEPLPPATVPRGKARKAALEAYAAQVMERVYDILPENEQTQQLKILDEAFALEVKAHHNGDEEYPVPEQFLIQNDLALAKFLHRPVILRIFSRNLRLPTKALQNLDTIHDPKQVMEATNIVLNYLENDNPYLLTYRFGPKEGEAMQAGLNELRTLAAWAIESDLSLKITPIRRYHVEGNEKEFVQMSQQNYDEWM